jgi:predicted DNA-binding protein YlxM (UPF0122 family)
MNKVDISKETLEDLYVNQKLSLERIAKKLGVCRETIRNYMEKFDIKIRGRSETKKIHIDKKVLEDLYLIQKLSMKKIAKKIGISQQAVLNRMKEFGMKRRTKSEAGKGRKSSMRGKCLSEEVKVKMSKAHTGKRFSEEHKAKISKAMKGERHWRWNGGKRLKRIRSRFKRRQLGFRPLNRYFEGSEAHHLKDKETVIFMPKELHRRVHHNNWTGENMDIIDNLALDYWKVELLGDIE